MIPNLVQPSAAPTVGGVEREGQAQPVEEENPNEAESSTNSGAVGIAVNTRDANGPACDCSRAGARVASLGVAPCGGLVDCLGGAPLPSACEVGRRVREGLCQHGPRCFKPRITQAPRSL